MWGLRRRFLSAGSVARVASRNVVQKARGNVRALAVNPNANQEEAAKLEANHATKEVEKAANEKSTVEESAVGKETEKEAATSNASAADPAESEKSQVAVVENATPVPVESQSSQLKEIEGHQRFSESAWTTSGAPEEPAPPTAEEFAAEPPRFFNAWMGIGFATVAGAAYYYYSDYRDTLVLLDRIRLELDHSDPVHVRQGLALLDRWLNRRLVFFCGNVSPAAGFGGPLLSSSGILESLGAVLSSKVDPSVKQEIISILLRLRFDDKLMDDSVRTVSSSVVGILTSSPRDSALWRDACVLAILYSTPSTPSPLTSRSLLLPALLSSAASPSTMQLGKQLTAVLADVAVAKVPLHSLLASHLGRLLTDPVYLRSLADNSNPLSNPSVAPFVSAPNPSAPSVPIVTTLSDRAQFAATMSAIDSLLPPILSASSASSLAAATSSPSPSPSLFQPVSWNPLVGAAVAMVGSWYGQLAWSAKLYFGRSSLTVPSPSSSPLTRREQARRVFAFASRRSHVGKCVFGLFALDAVLSEFCVSRWQLIERLGGFSLGPSGSYLVPSATTGTSVLVALILLRRQHFMIVPIAASLFVNHSEHVAKLQEIFEL